MTQKAAFDPRKYLTQIRGRGGASDYLEVKFRLLWLRTEHPDAILDTECLYADGNESRFRCVVSLPGGGSATGHGSETKGDFGDHYEKSETKAIGRALAALGFGTQFCPDHEFGAGEGRVVDAPVQRENASASSASGPVSTGVPATQRQINYLYAVGRAAGLDEAAVDERSMLGYDVLPASLSRKDATDLISAFLNGAPPTANGHRVDPVEAAMPAPDPTDDDDAPITSTLITAVWTNAKQHGVSHERVGAAAQRLGATGVGDLTQAQAHRLIRDMATATTP